MLSGLREDIAGDVASAITMEAPASLRWVQERFEALVTQLPRTDRAGIERFHVRPPKKSKWLRRDRPGYIDQFIGKLTPRGAFDAAHPSWLVTYFQNLLGELHPATAQDIRRCSVIIQQSLLCVTTGLVDTIALPDVGPKLEEAEKADLYRRLAALIDYVIQEIVENRSLMDNFYTLLPTPAERLVWIQTVRQSAITIKQRLQEALLVP